uniref:Uncharacterized protein LOC111107000 n=1 Tax=Crassostrea virginica TaxID=6565 RepID=A0A8B8B4P7_CRAVI|nr:uncharacterized protein LOC111107000 [Crassostrea virginica]
MCSVFFAVPSYFINRGYYSSEEITEADLVVFRVSMSLSASVVIGNNYFILVQVKSQFNDVWNHTFVITPKNVFGNSSIQHRVETFVTKRRITAIKGSTYTFKDNCFSQNIRENYPEHFYIVSIEK